jgi:hypothetical protein
MRPEAELLGPGCEGSRGVPQPQLLSNLAAGALARPALRTQEDQVVPHQLPSLPHREESAARRECGLSQARRIRHRLLRCGMFFQIYGIHSTLILT